MNPTQQKYATTRIKEVLSEKLNAIREKYTKKGKEPSDADKLEAIRNRDVGLKRGVNLSCTLADAFDF